MKPKPRHCRRCGKLFTGRAKFYCSRKCSGEFLFAAITKPRK